MKQHNKVFDQDNRLGILFNKFLETKNTEFIELIKKSSKGEIVQNQSPLNNLRTFILEKNIWGNKELLMLLKHEITEEEYISLAFNAQKIKYLNDLERSLRKPGSYFKYMDSFSVSRGYEFHYDRSVNYDGIDLDLKLTFQKISLANHLVTLTLF